jgi:SAM-dependent methyltransferase
MSTLTGEVLGGGERFKYRSACERYRFRPPYAAEVIDTLLGLVSGEPGAVLDLGCGPGKLARALAPHVGRVDAVDFSEAMIDEGRREPGGDHPAIRWILSPVEAAPLDPPYALAVAGASFHWFDQERVLARLRGVLSPRAVFAVLDGDGPWHPPWEDEEIAIMVDFGERITGVRPIWRGGDVATKPLVTSRRYERLGVRVTEPVSFEQSLDEYVACLHSRQTFCLEAMGATLAAQFGAAIRAMLEPWSEAGRVRYEVRTRIEWGRPVEPDA